MTVRAWRIVKTRYVARAFSGEGAQAFGGRWTSKGVQVVYVASTQSLAALEILVHLESQALLLQAYSIIPVDFPDSSVFTPKPAALPDGWQKTPAPDSVRAFGDAWVAGGASLALRVASVLVPDEPNFLLNPRHADMGKVRIGKPAPFRFDRRLAAVPRTRRKR